MKVLVAGSTGAIGKPLVYNLLQAGQDVYGLSRSEASSQLLAAVGVKPLLVDVFERAALFSAVAHVRPDVVIDMLTALPKEYTPEAMRQCAQADARLRQEGGGNLQAAAEACGVRRYIVQSSAFLYAPGKALADESTPFAFEASPGISAVANIYAEIERRVLQSPTLEGIALRFGFFYGPGTWFNQDGDMVQQVRKKLFPIIGKGEGVWSFVHVGDAGKAAADAVYVKPGAYNITNNRPSAMWEWLPAFARYLGAPYPPNIDEEEGLKQFGPERVYYATCLRGASNAKAKGEFNFEPRTFEWLL